MKEQTPLSQHMGVAVHRIPTDVRLSVCNHIEQLLQDFGLENCNPAAMLQDSKADLSPHKPYEPKLSSTDHSLYRHGEGIARSIADTVVYEIAYIVSQLARALEPPNCAPYRRPEAPSSVPRWPKRRVRRIRTICRPCPPRLLRQRLGGLSRHSPVAHRHCHYPSRGPPLLEKQVAEEHHALYC